MVQAAKGEFLFVWAPLAEETAAWTCVLPTLPPALSTLPDAETPISHCGTVKDGQRGLSGAVVELLLPPLPPPEWWFL